MNNEDLYEVLGVSPESEDVVIQAAYRALMRRYHPDTNRSADAARRAVLINEAYSVLSDAGARANYDQSRRAKAKKSHSNKPPPPPPPPPPHQSPNSAKSHQPQTAGGYGALVFASILTLMIIIGATLSGSSSDSDANNTMNVDENLTTDMNTTFDMNATDASLNVDEVELSPADLSKQPQVPVSYETIERAAKRVAHLITTKGVLGARAFSKNCHKSLQSEPSWDGADSCAAFDYAAAYIDDTVTDASGLPKDGYFQFQSGNQSDAYAAIGAPSYMTSSRLDKIRAAAQNAALEAFRLEVSRLQRSNQPAEISEAPVALGNSSDTGF